MTAATILIIEDDPDIVELMQYNLTKSGFAARVATDGEAGIRAALESAPDAILLDLMLPKISGLEICRRLRREAHTKRTPLMMVTAKGEEADIVAGLEAGADDYLTKPFSPRELVARVRALLRRTQADVVPGAQLQHGAIVLDANRYAVTVAGAALQLTRTEFRLLAALLASPGRVLTRDQLLDKISGRDGAILDRNIDVHIRALRKKMGAHGECIETVRGIGYKLRE